MKGIFGTALFACLTTTPLAAQHTHDASPYAHRERSEIAALTLQEIADLQAGAGMGFALAAELNHHPGPKHALELADSLGLTAEQANALEAVRSRMSREAIRLGEEIIGAEAELDRRFAHAHVDAGILREMTDRIAILYGELRFVHLVAHLETTRVLSTEQIEAYDRLRGYGGEGSARDETAGAGE